MEHRPELLQQNSRKPHIQRFQVHTRQGEHQRNIVHEKRTSYLKIANTGKGITPENLGKIFDRYKILDSVEMNGKNSRNGLGLAICKNMVTLLEGDINIESTPGELTTFTVSLPSLPPNGQEVPQTAYEAASPSIPTEEVQELPENTPKNSTQTSRRSW